MLTTEYTVSRESQQVLHERLISIYRRLNGFEDEEDDDFEEIIDNRDAW